jgi:Tol biopolymer transport system component
VVIAIAGCSSGPDGGGGGGGKTRELRPPTGVKASSPRFSPDSAQLAYGREENDVTAVAVMTTTGTGTHDLATDADYLVAMAWTRDGTRVIYAGTNGIRSVAADGSDDPVLVVNAFAAVAPDLAPDGDRLIYGLNGANLTLADLTQSPAATTDLGVTATSPRFSPDGTAVVYWQYDKIQLMNLATRATTDVITDDGNFGMGGVDWFSDGQRLVAGTDKGIEIITLGPPVQRQLISDAFAVLDVDLSPDETQVAYGVNGQKSLYVLSGF